MITELQNLQLYVSLPLRYGKDSIDIAEILEDLKIPEVAITDSNFADIYELVKDILDRERDNPNYYSRGRKY